MIVPPDTDSKEEADRIIKILMKDCNTQYYGKMFFALIAIIELMIIGLLLR